MAVAQRRFLEVGAFARELGLVSKGQNLKLELGSASAIRAKHGADSFGKETLGVTRSTLLVRSGKREGAVDGISVVSGLPWPIFDGVVAHELGHVWVTQNALNLSATEEEGICEVIAYHWYRLRGTLGADRLAEAIEKNPNPLYGGGFRMMRMAQGDRGLNAFLRDLSRR